MDYPFLSILPPILAIALAISTRQVILSLFISVWVGATFLYDLNPVTGFLRTVDEWVLFSVADDWYASILIFTMLIAATLALVTKAGGAQAIADALARKAKTPRSGMLSAWLMGMIIFFDDYSSCIIAGNTARPITDKLRISREKLSYIIDSTAAPIATVALISTWIGFELGVISKAFEYLGQSVNVYQVFLQSIPYRFYSIFAIALVLILIITMKDYGPMYKAEVRARSTGKILRDGANPLSAGDTEVLQPKEGTPLRWFNFVIPVLTVIVAAFLGMYLAGGGPEVGLRRAFEVVGEEDLGVIVLLWASAIGLLVTFVLVAAQRLVTITEAVETALNGAKSVLVALVILVLAWALSDITVELGGRDYMSQLIGMSGIPVWMLPLIVFLVSCVFAFAMGTSWGTMGIITPMAVSAAAALGGSADLQTNTILLPTMAAVLTGAIFGDHCSPLSDTTILSSTGSGADHIDHVRTQIPYAITGAVVAAVFGFIPAGLGLPWYVSLPLGVVALIVFVKFVGKSTEGVSLVVDKKAKA